MRFTILTVLALAFAAVAEGQCTTDPWLRYNPFYADGVLSGAGVLGVESDLPGYYEVQFDRAVADCAVMARLADNTPGLAIAINQSGDTVEVAVFDTEYVFVEAPFELALRCPVDSSKAARRKRIGRQR